MSSPAKIIFDELKSESKLKVETDDAFRATVIRDFISFLSDKEFKYLLKRCDVPHDLKLDITYTDQPRGNGLINSITDLLIKNLLGENDVAIIFRDERNPIFTEQSKATRKVFRVFRSAGGRFIALNTEWLSDFHALLELRKLANENQELLISNQAAIQIDLQDFRDFLGSEFESGLITKLADVINRALAQEEEDYHEDDKSLPKRTNATVSNAGAIPAKS